MSGSEGAGVFFVYGLWGRFLFVFYFFYFFIFFCMY